MASSHTIINTNLNLVLQFIDQSSKWEFTSKQFSVHLFDIQPTLEIWERGGDGSWRSVLRTQIVVPLLTGTKQTFIRMVSLLVHLCSVFSGHPSGRNPLRNSWYDFKRICILVIKMMFYVSKIDLKFRWNFFYEHLKLNDFDFHLYLFFLLPLS